jgi:hypothetical protein
MIKDIDIINVKKQYKTDILKLKNKFNIQQENIDYIIYKSLLNFDKDKGNYKNYLLNSIRSLAHLNNKTTGTYNKAEQLEDNNIPIVNDISNNFNNTGLIDLIQSILSDKEYNMFYDYSVENYTYEILQKKYNYNCTISVFRDIKKIKAKLSKNKKVRGYCYE